ncbi:50S ribosomal protein L25/general stress protein Ctc [Amphibacillus sp. MSJ-3]|uniref:50S ribosomal protein L25/general stress protein Ctc n=1 Tax=Amphibacillus sp. MSJ-3 TaxID=2841505 RepID=UPI001C0F0CF9|nr:50S ribosomal protein L25/general stress protein Ctc [Amphibacillus sp. MSJ-3]MBU5595549.1 50S ribosomal protein L25/general stress protein Ctc [Amphibacillus sp. MSJ-3]
MAVKLKAVRRDDLSKSNTNQLRKEGSVPAVVYGNKKDPFTIAVNSIELLKTVRDEGRNAIITLDVEQGEAVDVMLHEYQVDPIKEQLIHADFYVVDMSQEMDVSVTIVLEGEAPGTKEGGVLQQPLYELLVRAKPADIPEVIKIDVSELAIGDAIAVADLKDAEKYEVLDDPDTTIVTVTAPDVEEDLEPSEEDENVEPELVDQKGEKEEE